MKTYANQPYIYIQSTKEKIPVSQEEFDAFYKETSVYRRRQQRYGLCICPQDHWFSCDTDCENCRYRVANYKTESLDAPRYDGDFEGDDFSSKYDTLPQSGLTMDELVADVDQMQRLLDQIREIMPEAIDMGRMRVDGQSDADIAEVLGIPRTTLLYRLKKLRQTLDSEVSKIF